MPIHIETFCPHQVSWSGGDVNVFEWVFGEATVKERKCQDACGSGHCVTISTLLLKAIPWRKRGVRGSVCMRSLDPGLCVSKPQGCLSCLVLRTSGVSGILQIALHLVFHLVLITKTLCVWYYRHHFPKEETDAQRG